jgi:tripartite-type tricarboxylate transporter receptor subunit TctC
MLQLGVFMSRLNVLAQAAVLIALATCPASAEDVASYPSRTIKITVAFPPGGGPDLLARIVATGLERRLGKPVIVENMPGASGALAARTTARAAADGYTLQFTDMSFVVARHVTANFGVDPLKDFTPIGWTAASPFSLIASASIPASNVGDFIALAKTKPDEILIGHSGIGTTPHLGAVSFSKAAGIAPRLISYRGIVNAMNNAMTGIISGLFSAASAAVSATGNDKLRVLAVTGEKRMPGLPDIPTFGESGITMRGFEIGAWFGLVAPAGTPTEIVQKINAALDDMNNDADAKNRFAAVGAEFRSGSQKDFADFLTAQDAHWGKTLSDLGVKPE